MIAAYIAIFLSLAAFVVSIYTLWVVRVSPVKLVVYPPAVSLMNSTASSIVLDLTFFNHGRTPATVLDIEIDLLDGNGQPIWRPLKPQAFQQVVFPQGNLSNNSSVISHFTAFTVIRGETVNRTIYFAPKRRAPSHNVPLETAAVDVLRISFKVNNRWHKKCFTLKFSELKDHERQESELSLIKPPFAPRFFPEAKPLFLRGSIFDPVL